jgi:hypothetical protein
MPGAYFDCNVRKGSAAEARRRAYVTTYPQICGWLFLCIHKIVCMNDAYDVLELACPTMDNVSEQNCHEVGRQEQDPYLSPGARYQLRCSGSSKTQMSASSFYTEITQD